MTDHVFPFRGFETLIQRVWRVLVFRRRFGRLAASAYVSPFAELRGMEFISVGERSHVARRCRLLVTRRWGDRSFDSALTLGDNVYVGQGCTLAATGTIVIEDDVTFGDNVYVSAGQHAYGDPGRGVLQQDLLPGSVTIGRGAWIGYGAFVSATRPITIGAGSVVSANSVVTRSVEPFTVIGGVPARVIKRIGPEDAPPAG